MTRKINVITFCILLYLPMNVSSSDTRSVNDGNLILKNIPEISEQIARDIRQYQNTRSAAFMDWSEDGKKLYVSTRFGDVYQIHRVSHPGAARTQLTFFDEPVGGVQRQPDAELLSYTMDAGGSENSQIFMLNPETGETLMLSDGESRNRSVLWDGKGESIAYQSNRRNGRSNDIWIMPVNNPEKSKMLIESRDGSAWVPADFSSDNSKLLVLNYISTVISRTVLVDIETGQQQVIAGQEKDSYNAPLGFDANGKGIYLITNKDSEFKRLGWMPLKQGSQIQVITSDIEWDVNELALSKDRKRGAFTVNAGGLSELYLLDTTTQQYNKVNNIPVGLVGGMVFSPDGKQLAMSINSPKTPTDSFVLDLAKNPVIAGKLERWTFSEVGGVDTSKFIEPELIRYPTFDRSDGEQRLIPAFIYKPEGDGPFPVIISIHGGPESQARPRFVSTYQLWLNKLGVAVVVPNVRGSSGYGKTWLSLDNGFKREDSVKDIGALLDWIQTQDDLDQTRVALRGGSYGGYMVLASAVHYSNRLKAVIDVVGISNFVTFLQNTKDYRRDLRRVEYGDERDPVMRKHLQEISPLNHVDKIDVPLLVVQGQNDPRVPVTEAEQIVKAMSDKGQPVWYMNALNEGHGFRKKENRDVYQRAVVMFLKKYLLEQTDWK